MSKKRFYIEFKGDVKYFYRRHINFLLLTSVVSLTLLTGIFSLLLMLFIGWIPVTFMIAILAIVIAVLLEGKFILFAEIQSDRKLIIYDDDIPSGKFEIAIDTIESMMIDNRNQHFSEKYAHMVTGGSTVPNKSQLYISQQEGGLLVFGSKAHGGTLSHLKNFIFHEIYGQPHVFTDPVLDKKKIQWVRLAKEFIEGQWQIILNNFLILVAMSVLGWDFYNFIAIQFLDIFILALIAFFYNVVVDNRMSLGASFIFKTVSTFISTVCLVAAAGIMVILLQMCAHDVIDRDNLQGYEYNKLSFILVGISFFMSRAYLFLKGFLQNNHHKTVDSIDIVQFFFSKILAVIAWGILSCAIGFTLKDLHIKNTVLLLVGCVAAKTIVEMTHMFVLRKVSPKLVGILYPVRNL